MSDKEILVKGETKTQPQPVETPKPGRIDEGKTSGRPTPVKKTGGK